MAGTAFFAFIGLILLWTGWAFNEVVVALFGLAFLFLAYTSSKAPPAKEGARKGRKRGRRRQ